MRDYDLSSLKYLGNDLDECLFEIADNSLYASSFIKCLDFTEKLSQYPVYLILVLLRQKSQSKS